VEHPCYKCGAGVEDGIAFCPHCNAPQIRVVSAEPYGQTVTGSEVTSGHSIPYANPTAIQWSHAMPAVAVSGFLSALLMLVPLGGFGLGMLAAGVLAVLLYRRRVPDANLTPGAGLRLGAASGAIGFAAFAVFTAAEVFVFHGAGDINAAMVQAVNQAVARSSDPQARQALEYLKTAQGLNLVMALGLMVMFLAFLIFSSLGGAIGAVLLRRKERP
jgi:hypothetical protein